MSDYSESEEEFGPFECICYRCVDCKTMIYEEYFVVEKKKCKKCHGEDEKIKNYICSLCEHKGTCTPICCDNNWKKCGNCCYAYHEDEDHQC